MMLHRYAYLNTTFTLSKYQDDYLGHDQDECLGSGLNENWFESDTEGYHPWRRIRNGTGLCPVHRRCGCRRASTQRYSGNPDGWYNRLQCDLGWSSWFTEPIQSSPHNVLVSIDTIAWPWLDYRGGCHYVLTSYMDCKTWTRHPRRSFLYAQERVNRSAYTKMVLQTSRYTELESQGGRAK